MNARLKLVITALLLCLALALTIFCAVQTVQAFQRFQQEHQFVVTGDVRAIRPWMTVPYIAHFYHVPENYLDQSLHITDDRAAHLLPLRDLASRVKRPLDSLIRDIQRAILNYREQRKGTVPDRPGQTGMQRTRAGASLAPTLYEVRSCHKSCMVGAGLVPALVHSSAPVLPHLGEETPS